jgi:hypothetical protein
MTIVARYCKLHVYAPMMQVVDYAHVGVIIIVPM